MRSGERQQARSDPYRMMVDFSSDALFLVNPENARFIDVNRRACESLGYSREELLAMGVMDIEARMPEAFSWEAHVRAVKETGSMLLEGEHKRKDGSVFPVEMNVRYVSGQADDFIVAIARDISERKRMEQALEMSESRLKEAQEVARLGSWELDLENNVLWWSDENYRIFGVTPDKNTYETFLATVHPEDRAFVDEAYTGSVNNHTAYEIEHRLLMPGGSVKWVHERGQTFYAADGTPLRSVGTTLDITERKREEELVRMSRDVLRSVIEHIPARVFWKDRELRYLGCNTAFARDAGKQHPKELYGKDDFQMGWHEQAELYRADDRRVIESGEAKLDYEEPQTTPDGRTIWLRTSKVPLHDARGEIAGMLGIYEDITAWREAEDRLHHLNRTLKTLSACNRALVHAGSEDELWQGVCRAIVEEGGYLLAWVGYVQQDESKRVRSMASHAVKPGYAEDIYVSWDDISEGRGPTGTAVRLGKTQYVQDIASDPMMAPWRDKALSYGYRASIGLPLSEDGKPFGVLTIYAGEPGAFNDEEISLLEELASDLGFGIHTLRTSAERDCIREEQQQTMEKLRVSLEQTVQAMAATVELRDPYTAGHQRGVAELARAIACKLGMDSQRVNGLYLAGIVLDLGKIKIPAEILNYPGKLNEMQMMLVHSHAQAGSEILKDIAFPWPVAQIVLQHHERMDGSGYPQGLKGDSILLEARILAVADTVEAMNSHRPYRASLGLDAALDELRNNRGSLYDAAVVDACCELFTKDGYKLEG